MHSVQSRVLPLSIQVSLLFCCRLKFPRHPMLNVGTPSKEILLPIEVCKLASGQRRLKLDSKQTADMIKITATKPADRSSRIQRALNQDSKLPVDETVRKFGMQVSSNMALVSFLNMFLAASGCLILYVVVCRHVNPFIWRGRNLKGPHLIQMSFLTA